MAAAGSNRTVKKEGALSALVQVVVVGAAVGGGLFAYAKIQGEEKRVMELAVKAKESTEGDDAPALLKAQKLFAEIGDESKLEGNDAILSSLTELESQLYFAYGIKEAETKAKKHLEILKGRQVRTAERYVAEAYILLGDGKAADAERVMMELADKGIRHAKIMHAISVAKLATGKAKEAVVAAQEGQKLSTQLVRLPIAEGDALLAVGNIPSAANAYLKAKKLNPDHMRARTALTLVAAVSRQGKPDLLIKELDRLMEEMTTNPNYGATPPPRVKAFIEYAKGEVYLVDNNAKDALAMAEAATATDPTAPAAFALKGRALAKLGKPDLLIKELDRLMEEMTTNPNYGATPPPRVKAFIEYAKGEVYLVDNNAKDALAMAEAATVTDPTAPAAFALKGRALAKLGKPDDAKKAFDEALALAPASLPIGKSAFDVLAQQGKIAEGITYLQKIIEANPENGMSYVELSLAQAQANQAKDALASAEKATEKLGNAHDLAVFAKARALQADNQLDKAREMYGEALGYHGNPEWPELYFAMGQLRTQEKNYEDAAQNYGQAVKFWDKQGGSIDRVADAYEGMGKAYEALGKKFRKEASDALEKAAALRKGEKA